jgi:hypothetical protein
MANDSLILIDEMVLPDIGASQPSVVADLLMMSANGAMERTKSQWACLFKLSGLEIVEIRPYKTLLQSASIISIRKA